jgi:hypothetical protein
MRLPMPPTFRGAVPFPRNLGRAQGCAGIKKKAMAVAQAALYILLALVKLLVPATAEIITAMMSNMT